MDALGTLFTEDSFKLPITFEVIQEVLVMQVRDIWWVYVGIALAIFLMMTSRKNCPCDIPDDDFTKSERLSWNGTRLGKMG